VDSLRFREASLKRVAEEVLQGNFLSETSGYICQNKFVGKIESFPNVTSY